MQILDADGLAAIRLSIELSVLTTILLLIIGTPISWWLARSQNNKLSWLRAAIRACISLPLVLPPTVLGFYLLLAMGQNGPIGIITNAIGVRQLSFGFLGLLIGSILYSMPFVFQPLINAFENLQNQSLEAAATLRAGKIDTFINVALPLSKTGYLTGAVMGFSHTLGEFGVVLMIGGNIPRETRTISVQIFDHVEALEYTQAHILAGAMLIFSFITLFTLHLLQAKSNANRK